MQKLKYVSEYSLLVYTRRMGIKRVKCPFKVEVINWHDDLDYRSNYEVDRVEKSREHRLLYEINGAMYPYNIFKIILTNNRRN